MVDTVYRLERAVARLLGCQWNELAALKRAVVRRPDNVEALLPLAVAKLRCGDDSAAESLLHRLLAAQPDCSVAVLRLGQIAERAGDADKAMDFYQRVLQVAPDSAEAAFGIGRLHCARGATAAALPFFERAWTHDPGYAEAVLHIGFCHRQLGDSALARVFYQRAVALKPDYAEAVLVLANDHAERGEVDRALELARRALELRPDYPDAALAAARAALTLAHAAAGRGDHDAALALACQALTHKPDYAEAALAAAEGHIIAGDPDQAEALVRRALELKPAYPEATLAAATLAITAGDLEQALTLSGRAFALKPDYADAALLLAETRAVTGDDSGARAAASQARQLAPAFAEACGVVDLLSLFPFGTVPGPGPGRAAPRRPLICVPVTEFFRGWLGGQIYLRNFARILSTLPRALRPRLVVVNLIEGWESRPELVETLAALVDTEAVIGLFDRERRPVRLKPFLARALGVGSDRAGPDGAGSDPDRISRLFGRVDFTFPLLYPLWSARHVPRPLYWIPDFQHRHLPNFFSRAELLARHRAIAALAQQPVTVVFSSQDARRDHEHFYPAGRARARVWSFCTIPDSSVNPDSDPEIVAALAALALPARFYYTPNQFWRHKDHATLFRSLRLLLDRGLDIAFVCTGNLAAAATDPHAVALEAMIESLALGKNLRLLGVLPRPVQMALMRRTVAVIQPSLFEGWSTVVEDSRMLGRPLILSDIAVHREQAADYAAFFRAGDPEALARVIADTDAGLAPGPDPAREAAALTALNRRARTYAGRFLSVLAETAQDDRRDSG